MIEREEPIKEQTGENKNNKLFQHLIGKSLNNSINVKDNSKNDAHNDSVEEESQSKDEYLNLLLMKEGKTSEKKEKSSRKKQKEENESDSNSSFNPLPKDSVLRQSAKSPTVKKHEVKNLGRVLFILLNKSLL